LRATGLIAAIGLTTLAALTFSAAAQVPVPGMGTFTTTAPAVGAAAVDAAQDAAAAAAQPAAKKKPKPKKKKPAAAPTKAGPGQVLVVNQRAVSLTSLTLTSIKTPDKSVAIAKGLAAGGKVVAKVPPKTGCEFSIAGEFEDGSTIDVASVDVCKERTLNLVE
jgi:hypothetical protein